MRVCVCGLTECLCVMDNVMMYGVFVGVLVLRVWLVVRVFKLFVIYCMMLYVLLSRSFVFVCGLNAFVCSV